MCLFDIEGSVHTQYKYLYVLVCVSGHRVHSLAYANRVFLGKELFIFLAQILGGYIGTVRKTYVRTTRKI